MTTLDPADLAQFDQDLAGSQRTLDDLVTAYKGLRAKGTTEFSAMRGLFTVYAERDPRESLALLAVAVRQLAER